MSFRGLLAGVVLLIVLGVGGFLYRAEIEQTPVTACPLDAQICPDGTSVARTGPSCTFPACPSPNLSLPTTNIAFALPQGYVADASTTSDTSIVASFTRPSSDNAGPSIVIRDYAVASTSSAIGTIQATAIQSISGSPAPATAFSSTAIGTHRFTTVSITRADGVVDTAYYLSRGTDILRFDAVDRNIMSWADPNLDLSTLPAEQDLRKLLSTLQSG